MSNLINKDYGWYQKANSWINKRDIIIKETEDKDIKT